MQQTKGSLGFCRLYDNEAWHFEFAPPYKDPGCPARLPKPERLSPARTAPAHGVIVTPLPTTVIPDGVTV